MNRPIGFSQRLLWTASLAMVTVLVAAFVLLAVPGLVSVASAQTTHRIKIGGEVTDVNITTGVIWFNSYDPVSIVILPGDVIVWENKGGVHTVTSSEVDAGGDFVYDSSPLFPPEAAIGDIADDLLLGPGGTFEVDTSSLAPGTYTYFCKIHPGMAGTLTITTDPVETPVVTIIAGFGDYVIAQQAFVPRDMTVSQGTIVQWQLLNPTEPHTVTGQGTPPLWDSSPNLPPGPPPVLLPGQSFGPRGFPTSGTYVYFCKVHAYKVGESWAGMIGVVHVLPLEPSGAIGDLSVVAYTAMAVAVLALAVAIYSASRRKGES